MTTYTPEGFVAAKTAAWTDTTRNAPRDLYDLWALTVEGHVTAEAARTFKQFGPTGGYPKPWSFPKGPPPHDEWYASLGHQCRLKVGPTEAYEAVTAAWARAVEEAERG